MTQAWLRREANADGHAAWIAGGDWTIEHYGRLATLVSDARANPGAQRAVPFLDWTQVRQLDTAGAALLVEMLGPVLAREHLRADPRLEPERRALLEVLVRHPSRVYSRAQLFEQLYSADSLASDKVIEVLVSTLRAKLARGGLEELIQTRRGFGYAAR